MGAKLGGLVSAYCFGGVWANKIGHIIVLCLKLVGLEVCPMGKTH